MQALFKLVAKTLPDRQQAEEAVIVCAHLSAAVNVHLIQNRASAARIAARHIAEMELMCERLRSIVGDGLVELEKVEALSRLQRRLLAPYTGAQKHDEEAVES